METDIDVFHPDALGSHRIETAANEVNLHQKNDPKPLLILVSIPPERPRARNTTTQETMLVTATTPKREENRQNCFLRGSVAVDDVIKAPGETGAEDFFLETSFLFNQSVLSSVIRCTTTRNDLRSRNTFRGNGLFVVRNLPNITEPHPFKLSLHFSRILEYFLEIVAYYDCRVQIPG